MRADGPENAGFQFTRLLRGATSLAELHIKTLQFQFTRLLRGATGRHDNGRARHPVSIHAPLARRDFARRKSVYHEVELDGFNSRASCEARPSAQTASAAFAGFNSRASCEARQRDHLETRSARKFQFTRLLRGATFKDGPEDIVLQFQFTRLLRGATRIKTIRMQILNRFQFTRLLRGATG